MFSDVWDDIPDDQASDTSQEDIDNISIDNLSDADSDPDGYNALVSSLAQSNPKPKGIHTVF